MSLCNLDFLYCRPERRSLIGTSWGLLLVYGHAATNLKTPS